MKGDVTIGNKKRKIFIGFSKSLLSLVMFYLSSCNYFLLITLALFLYTSLFQSSALMASWICLVLAMIGLGYCGCASMVHGAECVATLISPLLITASLLQLHALRWDTLLMVMINILHSFIKEFFSDIFKHKDTL